MSCSLSLGNTSLTSYWAIFMHRWTILWWAPPLVSNSVIKFGGKILSQLQSGKHCRERENYTQSCIHRLLILSIVIKHRGGKAILFPLRNISFLTLFFQLCNMLEIYIISSIWPWNSRRSTPHSPNLFASVNQPTNSSLSVTLLKVSLNISFKLQLCCVNTANERSYMQGQNIMQYRLPPPPPKKKPNTIKLSALISF